MKKREVLALLGLGAGASNARLKERLDELRAERRRERLEGKMDQGRLDLLLREYDEIYYACIAAGDVEELRALEGFPWGQLNPSFDGRRGFEELSRQAEASNPGAHGSQAGRVNLQGASARGAAEEVARSVVQDPGIQRAAGHMAGAVGSWILRNSRAIVEHLSSQVTKASWDVGTALVGVSAQILGDAEGVRYLIEGLPENVQEALSLGDVALGALLLADYTSMMGIKGPQLEAMAESTQRLLAINAPQRQQVLQGAAQEVRKAVGLSDDWYWAWLKWPIVRHVRWFWHASWITKAAFVAASWGLFEQLWRLAWGYGLIGLAWAWAKGKYGNWKESRKEAAMGRYELAWHRLKARCLAIWMRAQAWAKEISLPANRTKLYALIGLSLALLLFMGGLAWLGFRDEAQAQPIFLAPGRVIQL